MGANLPLSVIGAGGGGKSGGGGGLSEAPDSLSSVALARFVDLIGEGQIEGLVNGEYSIYLDGVPLRSTEGTANYKPFRWDYRSGTQTQTPIPGFAGTQSENAVGLKLLKTQGRVVRSVPDAGAESVRITLSVSGLSTTTTDGKINGTSVDYRIWMRVIAGTWIKVYDGTIDGKTMSKYQRSIEVPTFNLGVGPYEVGVERLTDDSGSSLLVNDLYWDSFTIINSEQFSYPNCALLALELDSRYFTQIPTRAYHVKGLLVRVPTNYYPAGVPAPYTFTTANPRYATSGPGTTNGAWDGTFKIQYSNNPAWCYYDLLLNRRYGLGRRISAAQVDKWTVYSIGQYCDQLVATGLTTNISDLIGSSAVSATGSTLSGVPSRQSNLEPRFTLNCVINTREDAYRVLGQLTSVFRGMAYWGGGQVALVQDRFTKPSIIYTNANVLGGVFSYQGSPRSGRHTTCTVGWNDPSEDFKQKFEYIEDRDGIARYGIVSTDVVAFGCTSRSQARRVGLWLLYTERMESDMVTFKVGLDSAFIRPGMTALLQDSNRAGIRWGGRLLSASTATVTLDAPVTLTAGSYTLSVMAQDGTVTTKTVTVTAGTYSALTPSTAFTVAPAEMALWTLASATVTPMQVRILSVEDDSPTSFTITAVENNPTKYAAIDAGVPVTLQNYSVLSVTSVPAIQGLLAEENSFKATGSFDVQSHIEVSWDRLNDPMVRGYVVSCWGNVQKQIAIPETKDSSVTLRGVVPDTYTVTVYAVNHLGLPGPTSTYTVLVTGIDTIGPTDVQGFTVIPVQGGLTATWTPCADSDYAETEIRVGPTFATAPVLFTGSVNSYLWPWPAPGDYTLWAVHRDSSNNLGTAVSGTATVGALSLIQWTSLGGVPVDSIFNSKVGQSGNLLANTTFGGKSLVSWGYISSNVPAFWGTESQWDVAQPYAPIGTDAITMRQLGVTAGGNYAVFADIHPEFVAVAPGTRVELSAYLACHRCFMQVYLEFFTSAFVSIAGATTQGILEVNGGQQLSLFSRVTLFNTAPANAAYVRPLFRKYNTLAGYADSFCRVLQPYLGIAGADQTTPTPYSPSSAVALKQAIDAQTSAASALSQLTNMASDNILSAVEKPSAVQMYAAILAEQADIDAKAVTFGITTARNTYNNAVTALTTYLNTLSGWNTIPGADVTVVGTTFRQKFNDVYTARQVLLNAMTLGAKTLADSAISSISDMNADGKLVPLEKTALIVDWDELYGSLGPMVNQATSLGITTERDTFSTKVTDLASYLTSLSPAWNNTLTTTNIVRATADLKWSEAYNSRAALQVKISEIASQRAAWTNVSDRPTEQANLCWNGAGPTLAGWSSGVLIDDFGVNGYWSTDMGIAGARYALKFLQRDSFFGDVFAVRLGEIYSFTADCVHTLAATGGYNTGIGLVFYGANGAVLAYQPAATLPASAVNASLSGQVLVPSGAATARIWVQVDGFSAFTDPGKGAYYTNVVVRRAATTMTLAPNAATEVVQVTFAGPISFTSSMGA